MGSNPILTATEPGVDKTTGSLYATDTLTKEPIMGLSVYQRAAQRRRKHNRLYLIVAAVVVVVLAVVAVSVGRSYYHESTAVCTVTDKDRVHTDNGSDARVYTKECGTFQVADTLVKGAFRSADTFGALEVGHQYRLTYYGWRIGIASSFPNIIGVQPVE